MSSATRVQGSEKFTLVSDRVGRRALRYDSLGMGRQRQFALILTQTHLWDVLCTAELFIVSDVEEHKNIINMMYFSALCDQMTELTPKLFADPS